MTKTIRRLLAIAVIGCVTVPMSATAQDKQRKSVRGQGNIKVSDYDRAGGGASTDLGIAEIEGRIFKPSVFFVLARRDFQYQAIAFRQSFIDRIVTGALKRPF